MDEDRISSSELNTLFLALHFAVEECVAGRFSRTDLEATRDRVFSEYQAAYRTSDVPTGPCETGIAKQNPSAENQSLLLIQIKDIIDELDSVLNAKRSVETYRWLLYVQDRLEVIVKAVAVDTNEGCETASQAHTGTKD